MRLTSCILTATIIFSTSCGDTQNDLTQDTAQHDPRQDLDTEQRLDAEIGAEGTALEARFEGKSLRERAELLMSLPVPDGMDDLGGLAMVRDYLANRQRDAHDFDMSWTMANEEAEQYLRSASGSSRVYLRQLLAIIGDIYTSQSGM